MFHNDIFFRDIRREMSFSPCWRCGDRIQTRPDEGFLIGIDVLEKRDDYEEEEGEVEGYSFDPFIFMNNVFEDGEHFYNRVKIHE